MQRSVTFAFWLCMYLCANMQSAFADVFWSSCCGTLYVVGSLHVLMFSRAVIMNEKKTRFLIYAHELNSRYIAPICVIHVVVARWKYDN